MHNMDWHIHSHNSPCSVSEGSLGDIVREARAKGIEHFGISDHLHCSLNLSALEASRREFDQLGPVPGFHFGVEVSCLREWDLEENDAKGPKGSIYGVQRNGPPDGALTVFFPEELRVRLGIEYVIAGTHWPLGAPAERQPMIRSYHRQNMFLAQHPEVDIVAHPWWWMGEWMEADGRYLTLPWLDDFCIIPTSMHQEFAAAVIENSKAVEINAEMLVCEEYSDHFKKQYLDYLLFLKSCGVTFSIGSDAHKPVQLTRVREIEKFIDIIGVDPEHLWRPAVVGAGASRGARTTKGKTRTENAEEI